MSHSVWCCCCCTKRKRTRGKDRENNNNHTAINKIKWNNTSNSKIEEENKNTNYQQWRVALNIKTCALSSFARLFTQMHSVVYKPTDKVLLRLFLLPSLCVYSHCIQKWFCQTLYDNLSSDNNWTLCGFNRALLRTEKHERKHQKMEKIHSQMCFVPSGIQMWCVATAES